MGQRSIIICDDEVELAYEIGEFFGSQGWRVLVCASAAAVMAAFERGFAATCLLTDLRLGDADGATLIAQARELPPALRPKFIAAITGHATDPLADKFGADLLYFKPVDSFRILADVDNLIVAAKGESRL
jgi:CheY-like chemotaxis protein